MRIAILAGVVLVLATGPSAAKEVVVRVDNFTFSPAELKIEPGTTVIWENGDDIPHSIVDDNGKFHSAALDTGEKFSMQFASAGEIGYFCGLHPHMKGKIIVAP